VACSFWGFKCEQQTNSNSLAFHPLSVAGENSGNRGHAQLYLGSNHNTTGTHP